MVAKHERQLLREAIVARLIGTAPAYRTAAGDRVRKSRHAPNTTDQLPVISVFSLEEPIHESSASTAPRELKRTASIEIVGWVVASANVDDVFDALVLQIEAVMDGDPQFDGYASDSILENTQFAESLEGERPIGAVSMTYTCTYFTQARRALPTDDFETAGVTTNVSGTQAEADRLEGVVTIP
jgi:hypothetical protein